jgi:hypothetical protein
MVDRQIFVSLNEEHRLSCLLTGHSLLLQSLLAASGW